MSDAEKALKEGEEIMSAKQSSSFLSFFTGSSAPDFHDASEKFSIAGNLYKASSQWGPAGHAYLRAAEACLKDNFPEEAARKKISAAGCFKKEAGMVERAIELYEEANGVYLRAGRFAMVGNNEKECGEIAERELGDKKRAADFYGKAAERYLADNSPASAAGCKQKEALLAAQTGQYERAVAILELIAKSDSNAFNVKESLFKSGLVRLAMGDQVSCQKSFDSYLITEPSFASSKEYKLLSSLLDAMNEQDSDGFAEAVEDFERVNRLDDWKVELLLKAKQSIDAEPSLA